MMKMMKRPEHFSDEERLRELGLLNLEKRSSKGNLIAIHNIREDEAGILKGAQQRRRGNRYKLKHKKFVLDITEKKSQEGGQILEHISQGGCRISTFGSIQDSNICKPD